MWYNRILNNNKITQCVFDCNQNIAPNYGLTNDVLQHAILIKAMMPKVKKEEE